MTVASVFSSSSTYETVVLSVFIKAPQDDAAEFVCKLAQVQILHSH